MGVPFPPKYQLCLRCWMQLTRNVSSIHKPDPNSKPISHLSNYLLYLKSSDTLTSKRKFFIITIIVIFVNNC